MWSDNETAVELLGYRHLVSGVTTIVRNESLSPATVGVSGDWGGGKFPRLRFRFGRNLLGYRVPLEKLDDRLST